MQRGFECAKTILRDGAFELSGGESLWRCFGCEADDQDCHIVGRVVVK
jgi:hypothetical protein